MTGSDDRRGAGRSFFGHFRDVNAFLRLNPHAEKRWVKRNRPAHRLQEEVRSEPSSRRESQKVRGSTAGTAMLFKAGDIRGFISRLPMPFDSRIVEAGAPIFWT